MKIAAALLLLAAQDAKIAWRADHDAAVKDAKKEGKYVIVHFSGPG